MLSQVLRRLRAVVPLCSKGVMQFTLHLGAIGSLRKKKPRRTGAFLT